MGKRDRNLSAAAQIPEECSAQIMPAPARGPLKPWTELTHIPQGSGWVAVEAPYRSGKPGMLRDVFDDMTDQAMRRGGTAPFTAAQVGAARDYAALFERVQAAGVKCSQAFEPGPKGSGKVDFMDAYMRDKERLRQMTQAIGRDVVLSPRDHALARGQRRAIRTDDLVLQVCIGGRALSQLLRAYGWQPTTRRIKALREALCGALERMMGL